MYVVYTCIKYVLKYLGQLDLENCRKNMPKCPFLKTEKRLRYQISQTDFLSLESKTSAIIVLEPQETLKELQSPKRWVRYVSKLIPNLVQLRNPLFIYEKWRVHLELNLW